MSRLFRFLVQLVAAVLCFVVVTVVLMIFDGLNDVGDSADVALVAGHDADSGDGEAAMERVAKLFKDGEFPKVIVSADSAASQGQQTVITKYLEQNGVPSSAIIEDTGAKDAGEMASDVAQIMKSHELTSIMIVADYYRMSRLKLALLHAGVPGIRKVHVGTARWEDGLAITREVYELYDYVGRTFLLPTAEKIKEEASTAADKAKAEAGKAKDTVNKGLDSLPK